MKEICIWKPKYKTQQALVDMRKVRPGKNFLFFSDEKSMPYLYSFDGAEAQECGAVYNGRILCYGIPLTMLTCEGELPERLLPMKQTEHEKYETYTRRLKKK